MSYTHPLLPYQPAILCKTQMTQRPTSWLKAILSEEFRNVIFRRKK
jgi:hypothetical protein